MCFKLNSRLTIALLSLLLLKARSWSIQQQPQRQRQRQRQRKRQIIIVPCHYNQSPPTALTHTSGYSHSFPYAKQQSTSRLQSNTSPENDDDDDGAGDSGIEETSAPLNIEDEETLLRISLSMQHLNNNNNNNNNEEKIDTDDDAIILNSLQSYLQSFPFAAVLPVQPLTYKPRRGDDGVLGVDVTFLRKKTMDKGSEDGGIAFTISPLPFPLGDDDNDDDDDGTLRRRLEIVAVRNSEGQCVSKVFSEGIIVKALAKNLCEMLKGDGSGSSLGRYDDDLAKKVSVESIYHKWM